MFFKQFFESEQEQDNLEVYLRALKKSFENLQLKYKNSLEQYFESQKYLSYSKFSDFIEKEAKRATFIYNDAFIAALDDLENEFRRGDGVEHLKGLIPPDSIRKREDEIKNKPILTSSILQYTKFLRNADLLNNFHAHIDKYIEKSGMKEFDRNVYVEELDPVKFVTDILMDYAMGNF